MKNKLLLLLWLMGVAGICGGQNRANVWELGWHNTIAYPGQYIDFNSGFADTGLVYRQLNFFNANASICDTSGQLLFYTNGVYIANRNHDSLWNCKDFNPGYLTDFYGDQGLGLDQAVIILPKPGSSDHYLIFSITCEPFNPIQPSHLSMSEVDMNLDGGMGGIMLDKKNIHIIEDTLTQGRITACKHANGRDWWIIIHRFYSDKYYKVLATPDTIYVYDQEIGNKFTSNDINGMAAFSPDGAQYAHVNINDTIELLKFERCTGDFYNPIYLTVPDSPITLSATLGCQFSSSSRFLYVNSYRRLWQFDTWAADIQTSSILIDTIDPYTIYPLFLSQLAPDNKIYISTFSSNGQMPLLHVIDQPDSFGTNCNAQFDGFPLSVGPTNTCVPNFPNYDLGLLEGSACDTLFNSGENVLPAFTFSVSPNPASTYINIVYSTTHNATLTITNTYGKQVKQLTLYPYFKNRIVYTDDLVAGVYLVTLQEQGRRVSEKVVVVR